MFSFLLLYLGKVYYNFFHQEKENNKIDLSFNIEDKEELSFILGNMVWNSLKSYSPNYDFDLVVSTLKDLQRGGKSIPEIDCYLSIAQLSEKALDKVAKGNLEFANHFFNDLEKKGTLIELEKYKLYYEILRSSDGEMISSSPLISFKEISLDVHGEEITKSEKVILTLSETIPGFLRGVVGMREGEVRKIYSHPQLAYGKIGGKKPNQVIIFEVEALKQ